MKEGWKTTTIENACNIDYGTRVVQKKDGGTIYPVYGGGGATFCMDKFNREDCLVISRFAMSKQCTRFVSGKFFLNDSGLTLSSKIESLQQDYLDWHILALNDEIYYLGKGVAQKNLDIQSFKQIILKIPSVADQKLIVDELDLLSSIIKKKKAQLNELDNLAQSLFYEMFGDPIINEKGWEVKQLKDLSTKITNGNTPKGGSEIYVEKGIAFYRSQNVWRNRIILDDIAYIDDATHKALHNSSLLRNDILITKTGRINTENSSLGRAAIYTGEDNMANINGHVYLVRLKHEVDNKFVLYILISKAFRDLIRRVCVGGIDKRQLNKCHIEDFPIILPPLSLQQHFASKIEAIEHQKDLIKKSIKEVETLFNSRMDYYFN